MRHEDFVNDLIRRIQSADDLASYKESIDADAVFEGILINERERFKSRAISGNLFQVKDETEGETYLLDRNDMDDITTALDAAHERMKAEKKSPSA